MGDPKVRRRSPVLTACAVAACLLAGASGPASGATTTPTPATPAPITPTPTVPATPAAGAGTTAADLAAAAVPVPVEGRTLIENGQQGDQAVYTALVHGVRRVPGGTALYWSVGVPQGQDAARFNALSISVARVLAKRARFDGLGGAELLDTGRQKVYTTLIDAQRQEWIASPVAAAPSGQGGRMFVFYAVFPELPASVTNVDVVVGWDDIVPAVPVRDGALQPARPQTGPIVLGTGWPQVDLAQVAASSDPEGGIFDWTTKDSSLDDSVITRRGSQDSVDLASDVLFRVDSATLSAAAGSRLRKAAARLNEKAAPGVITVVGHTDSTASDAYNRNLSRRRAAAVAAALRTLITVQGVRYVVEGRGEKEPIATNGTSAGRAENRRVSVGFTAKEEK